MSHKPDEARAGAPPLRVLIVDDDSATCDALSRLLEINGFDARAAADAHEAIAEVRKDAPDVVLTDIDLRGVGGCELARMLLKSEGFKGTIAALTGATGAVHDAEIQQAGIGKKFSKPVDLTELKDFLCTLPSRRAPTP